MPTDRRYSSDEESRFFVLLNTLNEAALQFEVLDIAPDVRTRLDEIVGLCRAEFDRRFRRSRPAAK